MVEPIHVNVRRNRLDLRGLPVGPWLKPLKAAVRDGRDDFDADRARGRLKRAFAGGCRLGRCHEREKLGYATDIRDSAANRAAVVRL